MKKDNIFYYKNKHGIYYSPDSIRIAFYIYSGHIWYENMREFMNFLNKIWGKNIIAVCHPTYKELIKNKQKVLAIENVSWYSSLQSYRSKRLYLWKLYWKYIRSY